LAGTGSDASLRLEFGGDYNILSPASFSGTVLNDDGIPVAKKDTSGGKYGEITLSGSNARLFIGSNEYTLIQSMDDLAAISGQNGYYALARNLVSDQTYTGSVVAQLTANSILTGLGHVIRNLEIITPAATTTNNTGLVGQAVYSSSIRDLGLLDVNIIVARGSYVGAFIGQGETNLYKVYSTGSISGSGAGGLVGYSNSSNSISQNLIIRSSFSSANIRSTGGTSGGLAGSGYYLKVYNSHALGDVTPTNGGAGGLIGNADGGEIQYSYAAGDVISINPQVTSSTNMGGLIGMLSRADLSNSFATGDVEGGFRLGGLIGTFTSNPVNGFQSINTDPIIENCYATGDVTSKLTGTISTSQGGTGGLIGVAYGSEFYEIMTVTVKNSFATGDVSSVGNKGGNIGGLIGYVGYSAFLDSVYATGNVSMTGTDYILSYVGGLIGYLASNNNYTRLATITNSYATGNVLNISTHGNSYAGGLIGIGTANLDHVWASGDVSGPVSVGGLIGGYGYGSLTNSYATGDVTRLGSSTAGGVGGLIGNNGYGQISDSYATGSVIYSSSSSNTGGLVGYNNDLLGGFISNSYYNSEANSGLNAVGSGTNFNNLNGLTNDQIQTEFGDQTGQNNQLADSNAGRFDEVQNSNQEAIDSADTNAGLRDGFDNALNTDLAEADSEWQAGQDDRNAAAEAPDDPWQSDIEARENEHQSEIRQIEAIEAAEIRTANIEAGQTVFGQAELTAAQALENAPIQAAGASAGSEVSQAGEFISGASLNGLAGDSYRYGVEQMEVEGRSFSTGSSTEDEEEEEK
jgi:hypothetical protein